MRVDFTCAAAAGQKPERHIQVVAGELAWNETEPGRNATPVPQAAHERLLQIWTLPQGRHQGRASRRCEGDADD